MQHIFRNVMVHPHLHRSCDELPVHHGGIKDIKKDLAEEIYRISKKEKSLLKQGFAVSSINSLPMLKLADTLSDISSCHFCRELYESVEHKESDTQRRCENITHSFERHERRDKNNYNETNMKVTTKAFYVFLSA